MPRCGRGLPTAVLEGVNGGHHGHKSGGGSQKPVGAKAREASAGLECGLEHRAVGLQGEVELEQFGQFGLEGRILGPKLGVLQEFEAGGVGLEAGFEFGVHGVTSRFLRSLARL
jgi:hypothetical protein